MRHLYAGVIRASTIVTACLSLTAPASGEIIDRVLAIVAGQTIMLSDVRGFVELGLVDTAGAVDQQAAALTRLIERQLILGEVERYVVEEPAAAAIQERIDRTRDHFATVDLFSNVLQIAGLSGADLRQIIRDNLRIETYLDQRFASAVQPTEEEVISYYRDHEAEFSRDGRVLPFAEVREIARTRLAAERRERLIADWVASLRSRTDVIRLDRTGDEQTETAAQEKVR